MKIIVVGLGYVGLSNAVLLAQNITVVAVDLSDERVATVNRRESPLEDAELEEYLTTKDLDLVATTDLTGAVADADYAIIATPTDYDPIEHYFDTSSVEAVAKTVLDTNPSVVVVVKSTIPVGFISRLRAELGTDRIMFSPEFLREGRAL